MATNGLTVAMPSLLHWVCVGSSLKVFRGLQLEVLRCLGDEIEAAPLVVLCSARRSTWSACLANSTSVSSISTPDSDPADGERFMSSLAQLQYAFRCDSAGRSGCQASQRRVHVCAGWRRFPIERLVPTAAPLPFRCCSWASAAPLQGSLDLVHHALTDEGNCW